MTYTFSKFSISPNFEWLTNNFSIAHWVHPGLNTNSTCSTANLNIDNKTGTFCDIILLCIKVKL